MRQLLRRHKPRTERIVAVNDPAPLPRRDGNRRAAPQLTVTVDLPSDLPTLVIQPEHRLLTSAVDRPRVGRPHHERQDTITAAETGSGRHARDTAGRCHVSVIL